MPLVGADIVDVWTPQQFLDECPPILGCEEHLTMGQGEMAPDESQPIQVWHTRFFFKHPPFSAQPGRA